MPPTPVSPFLTTIITLLDQLDPEDYNWMQLSVLLPNQLESLVSITNGVDPFGVLQVDLFGRRKENVEFSQIVSKFLMDRERAGFLWVSPQKYADLARYILEFLYERWVYYHYILIRANMCA